MNIVLFVHLLGACVWVGGHLYLLVCLMPSFVKNNDVAGFLVFEKSYEPFGMSALVIQIATGTYMAKRVLPFSMWFNGQGGLVAHLLWAKLLLLFLTIATAIHARFFVVARLNDGTYSPKTLAFMALHVALICLYAIGFVAVGVLFR